jgi:hypothetical protein
VYYQVTAIDCDQTFVPVLPDESGAFRAGVTLDLFDCFYEFN